MDVFNTIYIICRQLLVHGHLPDRMYLYLLGDDPNLEFSDAVVIREKAIRVSGKFGGVAGVLHGVI